MYDKEGVGSIPTSCLREIIQEIDSKLTDEELDGMIEEIDEDGSGTVDFQGRQSKNNFPDSTNHNHHGYQQCFLCLNNVSLSEFMEMMTG